MTTRKKYPLTELSDAVAPARKRHRELIEAACAWQAGRDRPTDPDLFAMICAAVDHDRYRAHHVTATRWNRVGVAAVARCGIPNWCSLQGCRWPEGHLEAMWAWFDFLHETGRLDPLSDPVAELRKPLACYGPFDQNGRELPPGAPRQVECECHLPYRETAALLNELVRQCERMGQDPLDVLRTSIVEPRWESLVLGDDGDELGAYGLFDGPSVDDPDSDPPDSDPPDSDPAVDLSWLDPRRFGPGPAAGAGS